MSRRSTTFKPASRSSAAYGETLRTTTNQAIGAASAISIFVLMAVQMKVEIEARFDSAGTEAIRSWAALRRSPPSPYDRQMNERPFV